MPEVSTVNSETKSELTPQLVKFTYHQFLEAKDFDTQKDLLKKFIIQIHAVIGDENPEDVTESEYPWGDDEEMVDYLIEFSKPNRSTYIGGTAGHRVYFETGEGDEEGKIFIKYSEPAEDGFKKHRQSFMVFFSADRVEIYCKDN